MDLYFQAAAVSLAGAALAYLIYVMMTPAQMFAPMIEATNAKLQARIDNAVNLDISLYNNAVSVPGTSILPLLQDASTNNLAIFVQTRASKGLVVNYGPMLRNATSSQLQLHHSGFMKNPQSEFERMFVSPVNHLFLPQTGEGTAQSGTPAMFTHTDTEATYEALTSDRASSQAPGMDTAGNIDTNLDDPILNFWDPYSENYTRASNTGRTYSSTGYLFSPSILRTNMPTNDNRSYALTQGNIYYVNPGSSFYTTYILDATQSVVGIYVEEHGCDFRAAILAAAMKVCGYTTETFN